MYLLNVYTRATLWRQSCYDGDEAKGFAWKAEDQVPIVPPYLARIHVESWLVEAQHVRSFQA